MPQELEYRGGIRDLVEYYRERLLLEAPIFDSTNRVFKGQQKDEVVLCFFRKHWVSLLPMFVELGVLLILPLLFFSIITENTLGPAVSSVTYKTILLPLVVIYTYALHRVFRRFFNYFLETVIITNLRVVDVCKTIFFQNDANAIDIPEIQDMVVKQRGFWQTILNFGQIVITLSSVTTTISFPFVPNPAYHFRKINKTKREYIVRRQFAKGIFTPTLRM